LFTELMNTKRVQLGMKNTHFTNATGLPNQEHYSTANDIALIASAIIRDFPEFFPLYSQKEYTYNKITQPNRNRLLWLDKFVDGMKTGHTEAAGFCLVSTAKRDQRRLTCCTRYRLRQRTHGGEPEVAQLWFPILRYQTPLPKGPVSGRVGGVQG
jgi:D-alanyl-D-alanine carboxypeptidase